MSVSDRFKKLKLSEKAYKKLLIAKKKDRSEFNE